jgi:hypothetical protein
MGTDKEDTDPSSPGALRPRISGFGPSSAKPGPLPVDFPSSSKPTTDPGLGPRPASDPPPPLSGGRSHAVIVPPPSDRSPRGGNINANAITPPEFAPLRRSASSSPSTKDSVELLLEGMTGPRPERRKTTPQSDGEASAAYHAEHGLRPARSSSEPGPKVVVERPVPTAAPSRPRPVTTVPGGARFAGAGSREALSTFVPGRVLRRRVAMAVLAGVLIVFLSFMALRLSEDRGTAAPAAPSAPVATAAVPPATTTSVAVAPAEPVASTQPEPPATAAAPTAPATAEAPSTEPGPAIRASGSGTTRHHHGAGDGPSGDLGEFKAKF